MMRAVVLVAFAAIAVSMCTGQSWQPQMSGTTASLRGIMAVSAEVAWASGSKGTFLRTTDGGATWRAATVPGAADLDFRAVYALDENTAVLLSSGAGQASRVYRTVDGGASWNVVYTNGDPAGFFDAVGFWDEAHGILLGDPVKGRFTIMTTVDGGVTWHKEKGPAAGNKESAFAASGTCLFTRGTREAWFVTGGPGGARVFHTTDGGQTWSAAKTPLRNDSPNAGGFSLTFASGLRGVAVGGDYKNEKDSTGNVAVTEDGGKTWSGPAGAPPSGFRSGVAYVAARKIYVAVGTSGSDVSVDGGKSWMVAGSDAYNALSFTADGVGWAVGPGGAIAKFIEK
jgi:photosystem II stability/assembly factor-like uncharacterized protein